MNITNEDIATMLRMDSEMRSIKWNDHDMKTLDKMYTRQNPNIALELADKYGDLQSFLHILKKDERLKFHIHNTCFNWKFKQYAGPKTTLEDVRARFPPHNNRRINKVAARLQAELERRKV